MTGPQPSAGRNFHLGALALVGIAACGGIAIWMALRPGVSVIKRDHQSLSTANDADAPMSPLQGQATPSAITTDVVEITKLPDLAPAGAKATAKATPTVRPVPPATLSDWYQWKESQRLDFVSDAQHNPQLSPETVAFFRLAIQDKTLGIVTRNNASNALVSQEKHDPGLAAVFRAMVEDTTEDEQWRDYALQFLATSIDWSDDRPAMAQVIWHMAQTGPGSIPGTALLHLSHIDQRDVMPLPTGYRQLLATLLDDAKADLPTRMTVAGIAGQRKLTALAPLLRQLVEHAPEPALRRTALAALGQMGDRSSLELVQRCTNDSDPLIVAAAKGAERVLSNLSPVNRSDSKPEVKQP